MSLHLVNTKKNISAPFKQKYKETQRKTDKLKYSKPDRQLCGVVAICKSKVITHRNGNRLETALRNAFGWDVKNCYFNEHIKNKWGSGISSTSDDGSFCKSSSCPKLVNCFHKKLLGVWHSRKYASVKYSVKMATTIYIRVLYYKSRNLLLEQNHIFAIFHIMCNKGNSEFIYLFHQLAGCFKATHNV